MKTWCVYGHWTKDTNELFYIGVGTGQRKDSRHRRNKLWHNIVNKHGYEVHIICGGFTDRDVAVKEEVRLQQLNSPRACFVYGDGHNKVVSKETREKMSLARKGKTFSQKTKKHKSDIHRGKEVFDITTGEVWASGKAAAKSNNIKYDTLKNKLNGRIKNNTNLRRL